MKINILAVSVLTDVSAAALSARPIKKVEGGIMMRALQAGLVWTRTMHEWPLAIRWQ